VWDEVGDSPKHREDITEEDRKNHKPVIE